MDWKGISQLVGKAAPVLGTALGGPGGAMLGSMVATVLGVEETPAAVAQAVKNNPEALIKLKQFELKNEQQIREVAFKTLQTELSDKANARASHKDSKMPAIIVWLLTAIVAGLLFALFKFEIPESNQDVAFYLFGQAVTLWAASITYWVGTTRSSADKNRLMTGPR
ncbi:MAG: hypothetical protein ACR2PX_00965 [Endozoicomonas sp.]|uniref:hypothetical protein n=1 Tax=Endozoicomonas sp. TaxID=1892382 RepID=UPI003D9B597A